MANASSLKLREQNNSNDDLSTEPFPLELLLQQEAPMHEFLLPSLSIEDLKALEVVNHGTRAAFHDRGYWKTTFSRLVKNDPISKKIFERYVAIRDDDDSREGDEFGGDDSEAVENEGEENEGDTADVGNGTDNEREANADSRSHKRLCLKIEAIRRRLDQSLRAGVYESEASFPADITAMTSDDFFKFCFVGYNQQVDVLEITGTTDGAKLNPKHQLNWRNLARLWSQQYNHDHREFEFEFVAKFLACRGEYLIIGHSCALVTIWSWTHQILVQRVEDHVIKNPEPGVSTLLNGMVCKADRLMINGEKGVSEEDEEGDEERRYVSTPITMWKLEERDSSLAVLKQTEISVEEMGWDKIVFVEGIDFDGDLAVIAVFPPRICIWDLVNQVVTRWISYYPGSIKEVSIDTTSGRLVVASRYNCHLQMFSLQDGEALLTYQTRPRSNEINIKSAKIHQARLIVGFSDCFHLYDVNNERPITRWLRPPWSGIGRIWSEGNNVRFDGVCLIFVQDRSVHLYDFLQTNMS